MSTATFLAARDVLLRRREDLEGARREFAWPELDAWNWARDHFDVLARGNDRTALWITDGTSDERLSFAELSERSNRIASYLRAIGVAPGDRILVMLGNVVPLWEVLLAAMKVGAVVIPASTLLAREDVRDRFERGEVRHVIAEAALADRFAPVADRPFTRIAVGSRVEGWRSYEDGYQASATFVAEATRAATPLLVYFTSGTTARPKLVVHTHASYPVGHLSTLYWLGLREGDLHLNVSSPGWAKHAWSCVFAPWSVGATVFIHRAERFDARATLEAIARCGVTTLCAPPTVWRLVVQQDLARFPVRLRELASAGEPLNPEIIERVRRAWGLTIRDGYGQTETTALVGNSPGQPVVAGSMGRPLPGYRIALVDADGHRGEQGEIAVELEPRPLGLMAGYAGSPVGSERLYRTGDVATRDVSGHITYVGRSDDVFKSSDYRISPFELESALLEHPAVAESAVVPSPDPIRLAVPKAFVTLVRSVAPGPEVARDILRLVNGRLGPYKRIRRLEFLDALPKTVSGKIRRVELRVAEARREGRAPGEFRVEDFPTDR